MNYVRIMKAMIFAAGLGTRLRPFTDSHPKVLAKVGHKTLLELAIRYLKIHGIREILLNVHAFADQIEEYVQRHQEFGMDIRFSDERSALLETGGGLRHAADFFTGSSEDFVLMNGDVITDLDLKAMIRAHKAHGALATLAVMDRPSSRKLGFDARGRLCAWRHEARGEIRQVGDPPKSFRAFSGIHLVSPRIFPIEREGKFSIIDLYLERAAKAEIRGFDHSESRFIDVGKPGSQQAAEALFPDLLKPEL